MKPAAESRDWLDRLVRPFAALLLLAALWTISPPAEPRFRLCGYRWLTGHDCPFCGLTRALCALAKGHFAAAFEFNALSPLALLMLCALFWNSPVRARLWSFGLAAFAVYGVCRIFVPPV